ncbi:MAG: ImmA/IrrE family metallo-endopeptidase [Sphingomonas sp.]|uniref:ImmA/IrrE family metallo-endopeptidase n=1 Tax=Sphingomonas sp. TaxID=28214 RepID=UPI0025DD7E67|nr:ImmA/IrrE family metallo-endopeptidase [Sphingomonas sp.]MBX3565595.1 ImmA/IrrE family metallo-endopeptidase [Sphingomonas sp.]
MVADRLDGGMETLRGLLDGSLDLDEHHASTLSASLGGTTAFWLKRQADYREMLERALYRAMADHDESAAWLTLHVPGPKPRGRLNEERRRDEVRRRLAFYNVGTMSAWQARYGRICSETLFRTTDAFTSDDGAVLMWLRNGELGADVVDTRPWSPGNLHDRLKAIRALSKIRHPELFLPKLRALCAEAGVAVVTKRAPDGCRASGASRMVAPDKAMVLLSFRGLSDDKFWFTLFHELAHLILHGARTFLDVDMGDDNDSEREANEFAARLIVPEHREGDFARLSPTKDDVIRFSVAGDVAPGLTVGQMQHRRMIHHKQLDFLKRRWKWEQLRPFVE